MNIRTILGTSILAFWSVSAPLLNAQTPLVESHFSEGEPPFQLRQGLAPEPSVVVVEVPDGPKGEATTVFRFDDSIAPPGSPSYYLLMLPIPRQEEGVIKLRVVLRIPVEGLVGDERQSDFCISLGGRNADDSYPSATYFRALNSGENAGWTILNGETGRHERVPMALVPGAWYLLEKRVSLVESRYDWSLRNLSDEGEGVEGAGVAFYQSAENISVLKITGLTRGGGFEIAEVRVELE